MNMSPIITSIVILLASHAAITSVQASDIQQQGILELNGTGQEKLHPDMASTTAVVVSEAPSAREALDKNNVTTRAVIAVLKNAGVSHGDIQTSDFSVQPKYFYPQSGSQSGNGDKPVARAQPHIIAYRVHNQITIQIRTLDKLGPVLDQIVTAGVSQINDISFSSSKKDDARDKARQAALQDAMKKAALYAKAANVKLMDVLSITEPAQSFLRASPHLLAATPSNSGENSSVPVQPGQQTIRVYVNVRWKIAPNEKS